MKPKKKKLVAAKLSDKKEKRKDPLLEAERLIKSARRSAQRALDPARCIDKNSLSPKRREKLKDDVHRMREVLRLTDPEFKKKLIAEAERLGRSLSHDEAMALYYGLDDIPEL